MPATWEIDELLTELVRRRWTTYCFGDRRRPEAVGGVLVHDGQADVVLIRGQHHASAFRAPLSGAADPMSLRYGTWHYLGNAVWTLRAVLSLADQPAVSLPVYQVPSECLVPEIERRPYTVRFRDTRNCESRRVY